MGLLHEFEEIPVPQEQIQEQIIDSDEIVDDSQIEVDSDELLEDVTPEESEGISEEKEDENHQNKVYQKKKKDPKKRINKLTYEVKERERVIEAKNKELEELRNRVAQVETFVSTTQTQRQKEEEQLQLQQLSEERESALYESDYQKVNEIDQKLMDLKIRSMTQMGKTQSSDFDPISYFASKYPWFNTNNKMRAVARDIDQSFTSDPYWSQVSPQQRLDEVARRTLQEFNVNSYSNNAGYAQVASEPPMRPTGNDNSISITRSELNQVRQMFPDLSELECKKLAVKFKKGEY